MTVDNERLIVLDVVGKKGKRPSKIALALAKKFFSANGGEFKNEWPLGVTVKTEKDLRNWQKKCRGFVDWNLCIGFEISHTKECQTQTRNIADTLDKLRGFFDNIYIDSDDEWTEKIMEHFEEHPADLPKDRFIVYGQDAERRKQYLDRANAWYKKLAEQEWSAI